MSPMPSDQLRFRRIAALLLLGGAAVAMYVAQRYPHVRYVGLAAIVSALGLVRFPGSSRSSESLQPQPTPLSLVHWIIAIILTGLMIAAYSVMNWASENSPSSTWTVYAYAIAGCVTIFYWLTILAWHRQRGTRWPWTRAT
jgi:drug/metabolite transporter (DMT)-like permease